MKAKKGMSRVAVWLCMSGAGFLYWAVVHRFASAQIDCLTAPVWFGGMALLMHWFMNDDSTQGGSDAE